MRHGVDFAETGPDMPYIYLSVAAFGHSPALRRESGESLRVVAPRPACARIVVLYPPVIMHGPYAAVGCRTQIGDIGRTEPVHTHILDRVGTVTVQAHTRTLSGYPYLVGVGGILKHGVEFVGRQA